MNLEVEAYEGELRELRKAAKMALETLEDVFGKEKVDVGAINALRQALANNKGEDRG